MLLQRSAEKMAALGICDKIKKRRVRRRERGTQRNRSWVANRPRRQPAVHISIVRRVLMQILAAQRAVVTALLLQRIDHGWIALQQHAFFQAILKYPRNDWTFLWFWGFALDQRCQGNGREQRAAGRLAGFVGLRARRRNLRPFLAKPLCHSRSQFIRGRMAWQ